VPTITILISDMSSTVIDSFKRGTFVAADFTILLKRGVWHDFLEHYPKIKAYFSQRAETKAREKRQKEGILGPVHESGIMEDEQVEPSISEGNGEADSAVNDFERRDIERAGEDIVRLAKEVMQDRFTAPSEAKLARHLSNAIRRVASDINRIDRKYNFEEWAELTRLIRFTGEPPGQALKEEEEDVIQWDWLGDHSPMMANISEPEFVMEKLCESLARNMKRMEKKVAEGKKEIERLRRQILDVDDKGGNMKKRSRRLDDAEDHENR
jgi:potassium channel subfamily K